MDIQAVSYIAVDVSKRTLEVLESEHSKSHSIANCEEATPDTRSKPRAQSTRRTDGSP